MTSVPGGHDATLYIVPPTRPGDTDFSGNALHGELRGAPVVGPAAHALEGNPQPAELAHALSELRMYKDQWELSELRRAITLPVSS